FTQIDTDLEVMIPDEYVTNIGERYNLYNEIAKLENEQQLTAFQKALEDRFGPIPQPVFELFNTLRLQWFGKEIGFEKISFKKHTLDAYFINDPKSRYTEPEQFGKVLSFVQRHPTTSHLKQIKRQLRVALTNVTTLAYA